MGAAAGRAPREFVDGWKSKRGDSREATPYWKAISRPRSSGILFKYGDELDCRINNTETQTKYPGTFHSHLGLSHAFRAEFPSPGFLCAGPCRRPRL